MPNSPSPARPEEILLRVIPAQQAVLRAESALAQVPEDAPQPGELAERDTPAAPDPPIRLFDVKVYSTISLPFLSPKEAHPGSERLRPERQGLPLVAIERITVPADLYRSNREYGSGNPAMDDDRLRTHLFQSLSVGLQQLLTEPERVTLSPKQPLRVWLSSRTNELMDLPWELLTYHPLTDGHTLSYPRSLVRGLPPKEAVPKVPLRKKLRLLIACREEELVPAWVGHLERYASYQMEVERFGGSLREAVLYACREGIEMVHLLCDGLLSSAQQGSLYRAAPDATPEAGHTNPPEELTAGELSALLHGSRTSVVGLSAEPKGAENGVLPNNLMVEAELGAQSARAFAALGASSHTLPSVVAALSNRNMDDYWATFYRELAQSLELETAHERAQKANLSPVGLFLRHRQRRTFERQVIPQMVALPSESVGSRVTMRGGGTLLESAPAVAFATGSMANVSPTSVAPVPPPEPTALSAQLELSRDLVARLKSLTERHGAALPDSVASLIATESQRQGELVHALADLIES